MEGMSVPQREVPVHLHLLDGRDLAGVTYVPAIGPDGEPGQLIERLNKASEEFIAFTEDEQTHLVHESRILTVQIDHDKVEEEAEHKLAAAGVSQHLLVKIHMASGLEVIGHLFYVQPPEHSRLGDYLNSERRFIPLMVKEQLTYVNRGQIVSAVALRGE
jgi:hypothetical protein